ncbi:hypothetical protein LWI29_014149 [Acer saccharum]|uniref:Kinesin motor domain-containing protein n=1 Tax=Acer saccharum TaxID=4024 RepID=A0AA39S1N8_ACESA|nr:hypothetical protein LWI29_014149 [Acer saccharum]
MVWSWSFKANVAITEILISHGLVVDSISFASIDENDEIKYSERFGGDGGKSEKPQRILCLDDAGKLHCELGFTHSRKVLKSIQRHPLIFETYRHVDNKMWFGFTDFAEELLQEESSIMDAMEIDRVKKTLSFKQPGTLYNSCDENTHLISFNEWIVGSQDTKSAPINNIQTFPQASFEDSNDHRRQQSDFVTSAVTQVNQLAAPQPDPQEETAVDQVIVTLTQTETTLGSDRQVDSNIQNFVETTHEETSDGQVESSTQAFPEESSEQATTVSIQTPIHSMTTRSKVVSCQLPLVEIVAFIRVGENIRCALRRARRRLSLSLRFLCLSSSTTDLKSEMECSKVKKSSQNVRVAVNIRPLLTRELLLGCTDCITVVPGEPQVRIGSHAFTFDYVYGNMGSPSTTIYDDCVAPLVEALFHGFNATVLAYGQTGSGKTYMMGTSGEGSNSGVIPKVMESIFKKIDSMEEREEFLLEFHLLSSKKSEEAFLAKPVVPERVPLQIREKKNGGIKLDGVFEAKVTTKEGMKLQLLRGSLSRATGSTNMNSQSSRSHAIFTITVEQKKIAHIGAGGDISCVKLHLVDLAGTERSKRTCAEGMRLKEGIHINKSLLALGNVISALGDEKKLKDGGHVPYRDSKLTRLLQDSLGGNSKTVMIACVSPANTDAEETVNTLTYANRARNIQNKAVINRNPMAAEMQRMRSQIEQLQAENQFYRGSSPLDELQVLKRKVSLLEASNAELEASNAELQRELQELRGSELEGDLKRNRASDCVDTDDDGFQSKNVLFPLNEFSYECDTKAVDIPVVDEEKELEHSSLQEKLGREHKELDKKLEQKEVVIKRTIPKGSGQSKDFKTKKIFVGGIPQLVSEDELKNFFSKYGKVLEQQIILDRETNRSRDFGFITFDNEEVVDEMLSNGNMIDMAGRKVEIKKAVPKPASNPQPPPHKEYGDGYGGFGGSSLGGYRGESSLNYSRRFGPYGVSGLVGYGRGSEGYGSYGGSGNGGGYDSGPGASYGGTGWLDGSSGNGGGYDSGPGASYGGTGWPDGRLGYSSSSRYHPFGRS